MSFVRKNIEGAGVGVAVADHPSGLTSFLQPGCAAAILRRQIPPKVRTWLDGLDVDKLPKGRVALPLNAVADAVNHLCDMSGLPHGEERDWLQSDILFLAEKVCGLMSVEALRLRLDVIDTDACRKFHIDAITARLLCTYRGTGTQYGISTDGAVPKRVFTVQTGAPILLRGTLWPEQPSSGLLHRSPPIEGTGETRLVLVIDPLTELPKATT